MIRPSFEIPLDDEGELIFAPPIDFDARRARTAADVARLVESLHLLEVDPEQPPLFDPEPFTQPRSVLPPAHTF